MKILNSIQLSPIEDPVGSKFAMVVPVLDATMRSISLGRIDRLGGLSRITLTDVAREHREGDGDTGICFEYAVHEALAQRSPQIHPLASEVIEGFCKIRGGAESILFGPEKDGTIPILESVTAALTDESRIYVGNTGHPPKLKKYIPQIIRAYRKSEERRKLPRSINGLWKADLFVGNKTSERWVGTTVKINASHLEGAKGLRIGIYPKANSRDVPRRDDELNLIRLPLDYDHAFMELFYKSFYLVKAFLKADARIPRPVDLPDAEDRFITRELEQRRDFALLDVLEAIRAMSQANLLRNQNVSNVSINALLSEQGGLVNEPTNAPSADYISVTPQARPGKP